MRSHFSICICNITSANSLNNSQWFQWRKYQSIKIYGINCTMDNYSSTFYRLPKLWDLPNGTQLRKDGIK